MRLELETKIWVVTDAQPGWEISDILDETTLRGLLLRVRGGLDVSENPTVFTDDEEARAEAEERMSAVEENPPRRTHC